MEKTREEAREAYYHSWNGLFLEQIFSKGIARANAENLILYFKDVDGEIKRVDTVGFVTDVEGNHTGIVLKNDVGKCGANAKQDVGKSVGKTGKRKTNVADKE